MVSPASTTPPLLLRSPQLEPARHGFSTRQGGASTGRYASLNLGGAWGDEPALVAENRRRLAAAGGYDPTRLATARQVHGLTCHTIVGRGGDVLPAGLEADALVTTTPGQAVAVFTADCVPVLLSDGAGGVAAVHAGWRGMVAGVIGEAVRALSAAGGRPPRQLRAAIGPSIGPCCFEVGPDVAARFEAAVVRQAPSASKPHVDLWQAARSRLTEAGLDGAAVHAVERCTHCEGDWFFSYRRDGAGIGQMLSFIVAGTA